MVSSLYIETRASAGSAWQLRALHSSQGPEAQILPRSQAEVGLGVERSSAVTRPNWYSAGDPRPCSQPEDYGDATRVLPDPQLATLHRGALKSAGRLLSEPSRRSCLFRCQICGGLHRLHRLRGIELPVSLFNAASPLVPGKGHADMVWASPLACGGDFLLRLAICQGKDLIAEGRRGALAASWSCGGSARGSRWCSRFHCRARRLGQSLLCYPRACAVARKHTLGRLQFAELTGQLLVLCIDTRQRLADPLLLFGDLIQCRHSLR